MVDAAGTLLLSLEVEAAAARNAELSRTVEVLQDEVARLRHANASLLSCDARQHPKYFPHSAVDPCAVGEVCSKEAYYADDAREAFVILDELIFEMTDMRSRTGSADRIRLEPRAFNAETTLTERATRCLQEARRLKEALIVDQDSREAQLSAFQRALTVQAEVREMERAGGATLCNNLQHCPSKFEPRSQEAVAEQSHLMLDRVIRSSLQPS